MRENSRTLIISGAGIAGMASGLLLARNGFNVIILERRETPGQSGAGIQLSPNAMHVMTQLGLDQQVRLSAVAPTQIGVFDAISAKRIVHIPLGTSMVSTYGHPYLNIHRADLQNILLNACESEPDLDLHLGCSVDDATNHPNGVSVLATQNHRPHTWNAAGLIGADGVQSKLRHSTLNLPKPHDTGRVALRAMIPMEQVPQSIDTHNTSIYLGPNSHMVLYPVNGGRYVNLVAFIDAFPDDSIGENTAQNQYRAMCEPWHPSLQVLGDMANDISLWPVLTADCPKLWHQGNIGLIGDAAHAMQPHAAQGVAMALEDASTLASIYTPGGNFGDAFDTLAKLRRPRLLRMASISKANGKLYTLGKPTAIARNIGMKILGGRGLVRRQHWIYNWKTPVKSQA